MIDQRMEQMTRQLNELHRKIESSTMAQESMIDQHKADTETKLA